MFKNQLAAFTIAAVLTSFTALAQKDYTRFKRRGQCSSVGRLCETDGRERR